MQRDVPQTPAGSLCTAGGALHRPDGVIYRSVHPPQLRAGDVAVCQVSSAPASIHDMGTSLFALCFVLNHKFALQNVFIRKCTVKMGTLVAPAM